LSFRDKKSLATAFAHSLRPVAFMGSPHDPGVQIADGVPGDPGGGGGLAAALKNTGGALHERLSPS